MPRVPRRTAKAVERFSIASSSCRCQPRPRARSRWSIQTLSPALREAGAALRRLARSSATSTSAPAWDRNSSGPLLRASTALLVYSDGASPAVGSRHWPTRVRSAAAGALAAVLPEDVLLLCDDCLDRLDKAQKRLLLVGDPPVLAGPVHV